MSKTFISPFDITDPVIIDGDKSIVGVVTGIIFRGGIINCEVSYVHQGSSLSPVIESWRLTKWRKDQ